MESSLKIPSIGLGTYSQEDTEQSIINAITSGYRLIDTASAYENEEHVGKAINHCIDQNIVKRTDLFIITKIWNDEKEDPKSALIKSLDRLKLNYVNLYLIHFPIGEVVDGKLVKQTPLYMTWKAMEECVDEGLTKSIGVSNFNVQLLLDLLSYSRHKPVANEVEIHPLFQQNDLVEFCISLDIKIIAYNPLLRGLSVKKRQDYDKFDLFKNENILELARKYNKTPAQIILNWHLKRGIIAIPKSSNKERQIENLNSLNFKLEESDYNAICSLDTGIRFNTSKNKPYCAGINLWA